MKTRRPLAREAARGAGDPRLREQRAGAAARIASYRLYANLERPYAVWNVFAAPEFSMQPRQWCFAFAGCVNYRGYFEKTDADDFAGGRRPARAWTSSSAACPAYSLLGYFPDPGPQHVHQLPAAASRAAHFPRARAPGRLRARRQRFQRILRGHGRAGGAAALARAPRHRRRPQGARRRARQARRLRDADRDLPRTARGALRFGPAAGTDAGAQGGAVHRAAKRISGS